MKLPEKWSERVSDLRRRLKSATFFRRLRSSIRGLLKPLLERFHKTPSGDSRYRFEGKHYPGSRARQYVVHAPPMRGEQRPVAAGTGAARMPPGQSRHRGNHRFNELADREGFLVAYPFVTSYRGMRYKNLLGLVARQ